MVRRAILLAAIACFVAGCGTEAAVDPFVGTWHLDLERVRLDFGRDIEGKLAVAKEGDDQAFRTRLQDVLARNPDDGDGGCRPRRQHVFRNAAYGRGVAHDPGHLEAGPRGLAHDHHPRRREARGRHATGARSHRGWKARDQLGPRAHASVPSALMCGRYAHYKGLDRDHRAALRDGEFSDIGLVWDPGDWFRPQYNVAPTDHAAVIRNLEGRGRVSPLRWGLIPYWAKDERPAYRAFNARSETASIKPMFKEAFRRRRCLVLANGFYEWTPVPGQRWKQPHFIHAPERGLLLFAGLWERWRPRDGRDPVESFTILTTEPNRVVSRLHDRMPVILDPDDYEGLAGSVAGRRQGPTSVSAPGRPTRC